MSLVQRSVRSSTYSLLGSGITTAVQLARSILLARLIAPEIFGIYTFATSFVLITSAIPNFGMANALIHRAPESEGEEPLRVHFTLQFSFNIIWLIVILLLGIMLFPEEYRWVLFVFLATQFIDNLVITSRTLLVKKVLFRRIVLIETTAVLLSSLGAIILAFMGYGILGLISTDVITALVALIGYLIIKPPWIPKFGWSTTKARYLLNFGYRTLFGNVVGQIIDYLDNLWTGQFLGKTALGYYSRAYTFSSYPRKILAYPLNSVISGTYAELKDDTKRLSQAFFRVNAFLLRTGFAMAGLLALIAPEFIHLVIGDQWLPMLNAFRLMLLFTMLDPIRSTIANLFYAIGKPEIILWARIAQLSVLVVGLFVFGNLWGIAGIAIAVNLMILTGISIMLWQARSYVRFSLVHLFAAPGISLFSSLGLARLSIEIPGVNTSYWYTAGVKSFVFIIVYAGLLYLIERKHIHIFIGMFKQLIPTKISSSGSG